jgi:hypothetical protein
MPRKPQNRRPTPHDALGPGSSTCIYICMNMDFPTQVSSNHKVNSLHNLAKGESGLESLAVGNRSIRLDKFGRVAIGSRNGSRWNIGRLASQNVKSMSIPALCTS